MGASVINATAATHSFTLIFLHGLGDQGHGWAQSLMFLARKFPFLKIVCPHAPKMPVTLNGGMMMPAWYDIMSLNSLSADREDEAGLRKSSTMLQSLIDKEDVPSERVFIGGFSQGGAVSLYHLLTTKTKLAGVISLSSYVPCSRTIIVPEKEKSDTKGNDSPIFIVHGDADPVIDVSLHARSVSFLKEKTSSPIEEHVYAGMAHTSSESEFIDLSNWLANIISAEKDEL